MSAPQRSEVKQPHPVKIKILRPLPKPKAVRIGRIAIPPPPKKGGR